MADSAEPGPAPKAAAVSRTGIARNLAVAARGIWRLLIALVVVVALSLGALVVLDRPSGHSFLVSQLHRIKLENGIGIAAGRIQGSLFSALRVEDLELTDADGVFLAIPVVDIDWRPRDLLFNRLTLRSAVAPDVRLLRLPKLLPTSNPNILPDIDIFVGRLQIDRLSFAPGLSARGQVLRVNGNADIHAGRALVNLTALSVPEAVPVPGEDSGDSILIRLDIEPDRDRFDVDATVHAVAGGALLDLANFDHPTDLRLTGEGSWSHWSGGLKVASLIGNQLKPLADVTLKAKSGHFSVSGNAMPAALLDGAAARLLSPALAVSGEMTVAKKRGDLQLRLASRGLEIAASGELDFADELFKSFEVNARLLRPQDINPQLGGQDVRLRARLAGKFAAPLVDYLATASSLRFAKTLIATPRASGVIQLGRPILVIPLTASASRITGAGAAADALLGNLRLDTQIAVLPARFEARALTVKTDRLTARGSGALNRADNAFSATVATQLPRYVLQGLGVADLAANLTVAGNADGARVGGDARATMTRMESNAAHDFFGGLPVVSAQFDLAPDGALALHALRFVAPALTLNGSGGISGTGAVRLNGTGNLQDYGAVIFAVAGPADRLVFDLKLPQPGLAGNVRNVAVRVAAAPRGWTFDATAESSAGPLIATGLVGTGDGPLTVELTKLSGAALVASGRLVQTAAGPFAGQLDVRGSGIKGAAVLSTIGNGQHAEISIDIKKAVIALATPLSVGTGSATASIQLGAGSAAPDIRGSFSLANVERGETRISKASGKIIYQNGAGSGNVAVAGDAGAPFAANIGVRLVPDHITVTAAGDIGGAPLKLDHPAELTHVDGNWRLANTAIVTSNGRIDIGGSFGKDLVLHVQLKQIGLGVVQVFNPSLDLSGSVSGTIDFNLLQNAQLPTARADLRVNGLSRAGVGIASNRIDLGINAVMANGSASARMVIARQGKIEGRAQAQLSVIPGGRADPVLTRLFAAPLFAQLRWSGPAEAIWPLAGVDRIDVRGPVTIAIDGTGVLGDPSFSGSFTAKGARIESTGIGLVLDNVALDSRFVESRLELKSFTAGAGTGGTLSARGGIDLSAVRGFPMEFTAELKNAQLINRDDLRGSATGTVRIHKGDDGAKISGKLSIDQARINLGTTSVADVPTLAVSEINGAVVHRPVVRAKKPTIWQLDMALAANNRLMVRGMGLDSEWSADVRVTGSIEVPLVTGRVTLVRGDYDFAGKRFALTRGLVRFTGNFPPDPIINITAENSSNSITATLNINGTAQRPEISFSSIPALPEDEVLSRVLFGESVTNLSAPEALQLAGALATLRGGNGGLNPINAVRKGLGIDRLRILPADTTRGRKTSVAAGQYIGDRVYVEVTSDAQGFSATSVEVSLTRSLSILSEVATIGGTSLSVRWKRDY